MARRIRAGNHYVIAIGGHRLGFGNGAPGAYRQALDFVAPRIVVSVSGGILGKRETSANRTIITGVSELELAAVSFRCCGGVELPITVDILQDFEATGGFLIGIGSDDVNGTGVAHHELGLITTIRSRYRSAVLSGVGGRPTGSDGHADRSRRVGFLHGAGSTGGHFNRAGLEPCPSGVSVSHAALSRSIEGRCSTVVTADAEGHVAASLIGSTSCSLLQSQLSLVLFDVNGLIRVFTDVFGDDVELAVGRINLSAAGVLRVISRQNLFVIELVAVLNFGGLQLIREQTRQGAVTDNHRGGDSVGQHRGGDSAANLLKRANQVLGIRTGIGGDVLILQIIGKGDDFIRAGERGGFCTGHRVSAVYLRDGRN